MPKDGGLAQNDGTRNQSEIYFNYFSERVSDKENDTWVKIYLPLLKEYAEDYQQSWGKGRPFKAMKRDIISKGIPVTMRGQAWPLLIRNKLRINSNLFEYYKNFK